MIRLFIDTDFGSKMTAAAALAVLASAPETSLCGVGTVTGDTFFRAQAAKKLLGLLGKAEVPVAAGTGNGTEDRSWEQELWNADSEVPDARDAAQLLVQMANRYPYQLTVAAIGPLTNIAAALVLEPRLPKLLRRLVVMGSMFEPPEVGSIPIPLGFEYNFCTDNNALQTVLAAGFRLTVLPGDLTFRTNDPWTEEELAELGHVSHPAVRLLKQLSDQNLSAMRDGLENAGFALDLARSWANDELLAVYLLKPSLFSVKELSVRVELPDKYPHFVEDEHGAKMTVIQDVDLVAVRRFFLERLQWISDGPPKPRKDDVELALNVLMAAKPEDCERLFKQFCRRIVERQRRRSSSVDLCASVMVYGMASSLTPELMDRYSELWKLVCELEAPRDIETALINQSWLRLTELVDAMFPPDFQVVADAYEAGKIVESKSLGKYHMLTTKNGCFIAVETGRQHVNKEISPKEAEAEITKQFGTAEHCLTAAKGTKGFHRGHRNFLMYRLAD